MPDPDGPLLLRSYNLTWVHNVVGPEMCFGHRLIDSGISSQVGFVPIALGGTTLAYDWIPGRECAGGAIPPGVTPETLGQEASVEHTVGWTGHWKHRDRKQLNIPNWEGVLGGVRNSVPLQGEDCVAEHVL